MHNLAITSLLSPQDYRVNSNNLENAAIRKHSKNKPQFHMRPGDTGKGILIHSIRTPASVLHSKKGFVTCYYTRGRLQERKWPEHLAKGGLFEV